METVMSEIKAHNLQNRTVALMENGTWAPQAGKLMREVFASLKNMNVLEPSVTIRSSLKESQSEQLDALAKAIVDSMK